MDRETALRLSRDLKIHYLQIIREEWEMVILKALFESAGGKALVFKGGTALRLAYNSPRFSEDLDFSLIGSKSAKGLGLREVVNNITKSFPQVEVTDFSSKFYTYLVELKVKEDWSDLPFKVKIEISKRKPFLKPADYETILLNSPATNIQVLGNVATLEKILEEKYAALRTRAKARDAFDVWYISQKLKIEFDLKKIKIPKKELVQDLRKYLPQNYWPVIDKLAG